MRIILAGIGGQGILFATRIIAEAAIKEGKGVLCAETHGMAQRGASVVSHIKIGDYESPLIRKGTADILFCLNSSELDATVSFLSNKGLCFVNADLNYKPSDQVQKYISTRNISLLMYDADKIALEENFLRGANQALIGFADGYIEEKFLGKSTLVYALEKISNPQVKEKNINTFLRGFSDGSNYKVKTKTEVV